MDLGFGIVMLIGIVAAAVWGKQFIVELLIGKSSKKNEELKVEEKVLQVNVDEKMVAIEKVAAIEESKSDEDVKATFEKNMKGH